MKESKKKGQNTDIQLYPEAIKFFKKPAPYNKERAEKGSDFYIFHSKKIEFSEEGLLFQDSWLDNVYNTIHHERTFVPYRYIRNLRGYGQ